MLIHNVEQGSPEWESIRLGIPTASEFHRIITPTGKKSTAADGYANELIAEMMLARKVKTFTGSYATERGKELEPKAAEDYELTEGVKTEIVGFCTDDEMTMGCSPDRLVGADGAIEIKVCAADAIVDYILTDDCGADHKPQIQGQLFVLGRKWVDLVPFHPDMPPTKIRVHRDEKYLELMATYMAEFTTMLAKKKARMIELGFLE